MNTSNENNNIISGRQECRPAVSTSLAGGASMKVSGRQECRPAVSMHSIYDGITSEMFLNRYAEIKKMIEGYLPHWNQKGKLQFVTFRLADSMPQEVLLEMMTIKNMWLKQHPRPWDESTEEEYYNQIESKIDRWIDAEHGSCILRQRDVAKTVEDCLCFYDGVKYRLIAYVVMPNHVHVLVQILPQNDISAIVKSWKGVSSNRINKLLGLYGSLWQKEYYDTIVRNAKHFLRIVLYIEDNYRHGGVSLLTPRNNFPQ